MRKRKTVFLVIIFIIQVSIIWPVYPVFSDSHPLILGLPLSFAWITGMLVLSFVTVLWYYLSDPARQTSEHEHT
ncbi:MAG: hypothetical protein R3281_05410 [Balneolaceae bacterium]|nr:hypothetical protein [Balneolaceae bacterium]